MTTPRLCGGDWIRVIPLPAHRPARPSSSRERRGTPSYAAGRRRDGRPKRGAAAGCGVDHQGAAQMDGPLAHAHQPQPVCGAVRLAVDGEPLAASRTLNWTEPGLKARMTCTAAARACFSTLCPPPGQYGSLDIPAGVACLPGQSLHHCVQPSAEQYKPLDRLVVKLLCDAQALLLLRLHNAGGVAAQFPQPAHRAVPTCRSASGSLPGVPHPLRW